MSLRSARRHAGIPAPRNYHWPLVDWVLWSAVALFMCGLGLVGYLAFAAAVISAHG